MFKSKRKPVVGPPKVKSALSTKNKKKGFLPSSEAIVLAVAYVLLSAASLFATRLLLRGSMSAEAFLLGKTFLVVVVLLGQHVVAGGLIGSLRWDTIWSWQIVSHFQATSQLLLLLGLQHGSFSVVCVFAALKALGYGMQTKSSESSSPEKVVLAAVVLAGIIATTFQENGTPGWVYGALGVSAVSFWMCLHLLRTRQQLVIASDKCSELLTLEFHLATGSAPVLGALFWFYSRDDVLSLASLTAPLSRISYASLLLLGLVVVLDQFRGHLAQRAVQASSVRFVVGVNLLAYLALLVVGSGLQLLDDESNGLVASVLMALGSISAIAFVSKDAARMAPSRLVLFQH